MKKQRKINMKRYEKRVNLMKEKQKSMQKTRNKRQQKMQPVAKLRQI